MNDTRVDGGLGMYVGSTDKVGRCRLRGRYVLLEEEADLEEESVVSVGVF